LIPLIIVPLTISTFYDIQTAIIIHLLTVFATGYMVPNGFEFTFMQFAAGLGAVLTRHKINHRSHFIKVSALVFAIYSVIYTGLVLTHEGNFAEIKMVKYAVFAINALLLLLAFPLFYFFEKVFGFLSNITLLELSDTNRPLLRMIAEKAPGTFQHSMQVANLAEEAVMQIGGNPLLVRVGAMYHDIGKTEAPAYFIENKHSSQNPHDLLEPERSAEIIINHIKRGIEIAEKNNLPKEVIDFIRTHQGTGKVRWFLNAYKIEHPDVVLDETKFEYPGPIPFSKETAVLMMADSIEAASRSMKEFSEESISNLVEKIIDYQIKEKQFEEADITFAEINRVKSVFKQKLVNIYHTRIEYPKE
jgi:putative nucleotidyltransferase with HDIG domain